MTAYWLLFAMWTLNALQSGWPGAQARDKILFVAATIITTLMIGLRFEVGGDWTSYLAMYQEMSFLELRDAMRITDPGYAFLNWLAAGLTLQIWFVNLICAILFMVGVSRLAWRQRNPSLTMLVAVPYLIIVVGMGYTRQAAAIGIICFAIADASERQLVRLIMLIGIAALFHKTAILILPIALVPVLRRNSLYGAVGALFFGILFILLLGDASDSLIANYVQSTYDSQGAVIRIAMNVLAAVIFLFFRKSINIPPFQKSYWSMCALLALLSVPALQLSSASSGIDRISLYLIPLQMVAFGQLPYLLRRDGSSLPSAFLGIFGYSFGVAFVWLNFADNAIAWLPYRIAV